MPKILQMAPSTLTGRGWPALAGGVRAAPFCWGFIGAGAVAIGIYFLLPPDAQSVYFVAVGLASVATIYAGARVNLPPGQRLPWNLFALGLLGQVAGDAIFAVYEISLNREPPSPSIADVFYLGSYPLLAAGVLLVLRQLGGQTSRAAILDTVIVFCGLALVQWVFFIDPYNHRQFGTEGARLVAMAYPAVDVLLLVALTQLLVGPGGRTTAYRLLLTSVALWVIADEIYGLNYDTYTGGDPVDALWLASYVIWAGAALSPSMARIAQPERRLLPRLTVTRLLSRPAGASSFAASSAPALQEMK